jgi:hypothetical protein
MAGTDLDYRSRAYIAERFGNLQTRVLVDEEVLAELWFLHKAESRGSRVEKLRRRTDREKL